MGTITPGQMYDHSLNVIKGPALMRRLDFHAQPKALEFIQAGAVVSVDSTGKFVNGAGAGSFFNRPMPIWAIQNVNDFDANSDVGNISGGVMSGVVATGGFEVETTEFVTGTYNRNDLLTAASGVNKGKMIRCSVSPYGNQPVHGCVSDGISTNADGKTALRFWTVFLPASAVHEYSSSSESSTSQSSLSSTSQSSTSQSSTSQSSTSQSSVSPSSLSSTSQTSVESPLNTSSSSVP